MLGIAVKNQFQEQFQAIPRACDAIEITVKYAIPEKNIGWELLFTQNMPFSKKQCCGKSHFPKNAAGILIGLCHIVNFFGHAKKFTKPGGSALGEGGWGDFF